MNDAKQGSHHSRDAAPAAAHPPAPAHPAAHATAHAAPHPAPPAPEPERRRILVVTDDSDARALFARAFRKSTSGPALCVDTASADNGADTVRRALVAGDAYAAAFVATVAGAKGAAGLKAARQILAADPSTHVVLCAPPSASLAADLAGMSDAAGEDDRVLFLAMPFEPVEALRLAGALSAKWSAARKLAEETAAREKAQKDLAAAAATHQKVLHLAAAAVRGRDRLRMEELEAVVQQRTAELRRAATHDDLTGLANRALFHDRLVQALELTRRLKDYRIAVLFIDFDKFKTVNDSLGHEAGDLLLKAIGERLTSALRSTDTVSPAAAQAATPAPAAVPHAGGGEGAAAHPGEDAGTAARLGGDEFCILLSGLRHDRDAALVADRILQALKAPYSILGHEVNSAASIGIAVSSSGYERAEDMVRDADSAMYRAKAAGGGRFVLFDRAMHEQAIRRLTVESDLRRAIERGEMRVHYQPVVSLSTGAFCGVEALARWQHPERGMIGPADFITVAEDTGFIVELGGWMLEQACRQLADWRRRMPLADAMKVSVNVSAKQLKKDGFAERVAAALREAALDPKALTLEFTESALNDGGEAAEATLRALRATGVSVILDDFGTGPSSISSLNEFPLDGLKIDRTFVHDASGRRRYAAVVHAITNLAQNLGIEVVAEGVESLEQVALLQALDCPKAQGYLFSRPAPADTIEQLLRRTTWSAAA